MIRYTALLLITLPALALGLPSASPGADKSADTQAQLKAVVERMQSPEKATARAALKDFQRLAPAGGMAAFEEVFQAFQKDTLNQTLSSALYAMEPLAVPELFKRLKSDEPKTRRTCVCGLAVIWWRLAHEAPRERRDTIQALETALFDALRDPDEWVCVDAIGLLPQGAASKDPRLTSELIRIIKTKSCGPVRRSFALNAFRYMGLDGKDGIPTLIDVLESDEMDGFKDGQVHPIRGIACRSLAAMQPEPRALKCLTKVLKNRAEDRFIRLGAAESLVQWAEDKEALVPSMLDLMEDCLNESGNDQFGTVVSSIRYLGKLGRHGRKALPRLRELEKEFAGSFYIPMALREAIPAIEAAKSPKCWQRVVQWLPEFRLSFFRLRSFK